MVVEEAASNKAAELRRQIAAAEHQLSSLRHQLAALEERPESSPPSPNPPLPHVSTEWKWPLREHEYARYGRQLIVPSLGIQGQLNLKASRVLIVGAGGLGCPAALYLAGAGIGTLGIVDGDTVELSNLHRQIGHATGREGMLKVDSLIHACRSLNPDIRYVRHPAHLAPHSADLVQDYDLVLDCTDHPTSRYLISDICVLLGKPLVSASALRTDGQLIVLNHPASPRGSPDGGPCYRCVFPRPPPADSVVSCGEGGILGPVVGVMGVLQALEAIHLIARGTTKETEKEPRPRTMHLFSATSTTPFRTVRMRARRPDCFACSAHSSLSFERLRAGAVDYVQFCGVPKPIDLLGPHERISASEYSTAVARQGEGKHLLIDVRDKVHFDISSIPGAVNVPLQALRAQREESRPDWLPATLASDATIYTVCHVGNDSQLAVGRLREMGLGNRHMADIRGGMRAWKLEVDGTIPFSISPA